MAKADGRPLVVLDTSCLIALEQAEPQARALRQIEDRFQSGDIRLAISVVSSSENPHEGRTNEWEEFGSRLSDVGLQDVAVLDTLAIVGLARVGRAVVPGEGDPFDRIFEALFPGTSRDLAKFARDRRESEDVALPAHRNRMCDASVIWSVWHAGGGWLVTTDGNFHRKRTAMLDYRVVVMSADEAVQRLEA